MNMPDFTDRACAGYDPEAFFPEHGPGYGIACRQAKSICNGQPAYDIPPCPVRDACLQMALANEGTLTSPYRFGVYGGRTPKERAKVARKGIELQKRCAA